MLLRFAKPSDLSEISRIYAASWKQAYRGMVPQAYLDRLPEDFGVPSFSQRLEQGIYTMTVAEHQGALLGCVIYGPSREEDHDDWGEICSIYVLPSHVGKGVGHLLLEHAMQKMQRIGTEKVFLWVLEQNLHARRFYERHGFSFEGERGQIVIEGMTLSEFRYVWKTPQADSPV